MCIYPTEGWLLGLSLDIVFPYLCNGCEGSSKILKEKLKTYLSAN